MYKVLGTNLTNIQEVCLSFSLVTCVFEDLPQQVSKFWFYYRSFEEKSILWGC